MPADLSLKNALKTIKINIISVLTTLNYRLRSMHPGQCVLFEFSI